MSIDKKYQKKKKLLESEVTSEGVMQPSEVDILLKTISNYEQVLFQKDTEETQRTSMTTEIAPSSIQHLISLYNKAIEYYSAMNDERHMQFLQKL